MQSEGSADDAAAGQLLAETWRRLADHARTILGNTSMYIHTLAVARQEAAASDLAGYVRYKARVVEYGQGFARSLDRVSARLQRLFRAWENSGASERILTALAQHAAGPSLRDAAPDELWRDATNQMSAVTDWFRGPEWAEYLGRAARFEANAVLQRAQLLAATSHLSVGYLADLQTLAQELLWSDDRSPTAGG